MSHGLSRRELLTNAGAACLGVSVMAGAKSQRVAAAAQKSSAARPANEPFGYCLNLSTIRGQKLPLAQEIEIAAKAGYHAIEPWMNKIDEHVKSGGSLRDLGKRIADLGLTVESAIGFAEWIVDDDARRAKGLEQAKRDMAALREIGGKRIAAPPAGATDQTDMNLFRAAERYAALVDLGEKMEVIPQVEVWGFSKCLSRLGETTFVAVESGRAKACILPDVYHIYKGGSDFAGLGLLSGRRGSRVSRQRLSRQAEARHDQRLASRVSRRRCRAAVADSPHDAWRRVPRLPFAGAVQQGILEAGRPGSRAHRSAKIARSRSAGVFLSFACQRVPPLAASSVAKRVPLTSCGSLSVLPLSAPL
jgi:hypothetical protein